MSRTGVLLTAFGGPDCLAAVEPFMCALMGRQPSAEVVESAKRRYLTIGGGSPLPGIAERIAAQLERRLNGLRPADETPPEVAGLERLGSTSHGLRASEGVLLPVAVGMCYSEPSISRGIETLLAAGADTIVSLPLSPFDAAVTTGAYRSAIEAAVAGRARVLDAAAYHLSSGFVDLVAERLADALEDLAGQSRTLVVFTAHSLPVADIEADPSYVEQIRATVAAVAHVSGLGAPGAFTELPGVDAFGGSGGTAPWLLAFQSKGARPGAWLGPDLDAVIDEAALQSFGAVVVCPVGFVTDHLETLYDIDVLAADRVLTAGMEFARTAAPNDAPLLIDALAEAVRAVI